MKKKREYVYTIVRMATGYEPHAISSHAEYDDALSMCSVYEQELLDKNIPLEGIEFKIQMNSWHE